MALMQPLSNCYQKTFKSAANPHKYWLLKAFQIIQTPDRQYGVLAKIVDFKPF